jgi:hypothetical protein
LAKPLPRGAGFNDQEVLSDLLKKGKRNGRDFLTHVPGHGTRLNGSSGPIKVMADTVLRIQACLNPGQPALFGIVASPVNPLGTINPLEMVILTVEPCYAASGLDFCCKIPLQTPQCSLYIKAFAVVDDERIYCSPCQNLKIWALPPPTLP